jgi:hypothetical protein
MAKMKLLFVEDEPDNIAAVLHLLGKSADYDMDVKCFVQARDALETMTITPDVIVLDLLEKGASPEPETPGLQTFEWVWESRFCPIVIYSAQPGLCEAEHPFVKKVSKGRGSPDQVAAVLQQFRPHVEALHEVEKQIRQQFATALRHVAPYAFGVCGEEESEKLNDMILRAGRRRLAALMDNDSRHGQKLADWEQYLFPPVSEDLTLGDILREKGKDDPASFCVVLTPSCDLVASGGREPKVSSVLLARCCAINEAIKLTSLGEMGMKKLQDHLPPKLSQGYFETILPLPALKDLIPHMAANLKDLAVVPFQEIKERFDVVASVDSPFRELVAWAYMQVACRPGLPDRDFKQWGERIIEHLKEATSDGKKG